MNKYDNAKTDDLGKEKHVPVVSVNKNKVMVMIGSTPHPMSEDHYIEWIELETNLDNYRKELSPDIPATAIFELENGEYVMNVYCHCNIHGLWAKRMPRKIKSSCQGQIYNWD